MRKPLSSQAAYSSVIGSWSPTGVAYPSSSSEENTPSSETWWACEDQLAEAGLEARSKIDPADTSRVPRNSMSSSSYDAAERCRRD